MTRVVLPHPIVMSPGGDSFLAVFERFAPDRRCHCAPPVHLQVSDATLKAPLSTRHVNRLSLPSRTMVKTRKTTDKGNPVAKKQKYVPSFQLCLRSYEPLRRTKDVTSSIDFSTFSPEQLLAFAHALNSHIETRPVAVAPLTQPVQQ